jgi:GTP-binding protein
MEVLYIDLPEEHAGKAIEMVSSRRGQMLMMERRGDRVHLEFEIPSRGIIGLRSNLLTATAGEAVMCVCDFEPERRYRTPYHRITDRHGIRYGLRLCHTN